MHVAACNLPESCTAGEHRFRSQPESWLHVISLIAADQATLRLRTAFWHDHGLYAGAMKWPFYAHCPGCFPDSRDVIAKRLKTPLACETDLAELSYHNYNR